MPGKEFKVCMAREHGPCDPSPCSEAEHCDCTVWNGDKDRDGRKVEGCAPDIEHSDCDDNDGTRARGFIEVCADDMTHDEDCDDATFGNKDTDGDLAIDQACSNKSDYQPLFFRPPQPLISSHGTDCDDREPLTNPNAEEICDLQDNNCNGQIDEVPEGQGITYYQDLDGDHWGNDAKTQQSLCGFAPPRYVNVGGDCDDQNPWINPGREEICNGVDDDCDPEGKLDQPDKPGHLMSGQPYDGGSTQFECKGFDGWKVKQCPSDRLDCNDGYLDACETPSTTLCDCHKCGTSCAFSCGSTGCEEIRVLSTGNTHTCAIVSESPDVTVVGGKVACWGRNLFGQLGDGKTRDSAIPVWVDRVEGATAIALGDSHSCAITSDSEIKCWGDNALSKLGAGSELDQSVNPLLVLSVAQWGKPTKLAASTEHTCAVYGQGRVGCWGSNHYGQLGDGYQGDGLFSNGPTLVLREVGGVRSLVQNATQVAAGERFTCLLAAGKVECWGDNSFGQLGEDPDLVSSRPVARPVPGLETIVVDQLVATASHACARAGNDVYCWGDNSVGELGNDNGGIGLPTKIELRLPPDITITSIAAGRYFGCARSSDGVARCWGSNDSGQLTLPSDTPSAPPTLISLPDIAGIFGGDGQHVCALTADAKTWCWGRNDLGQLGNGALAEAQSTPTAVNAQNPGQVCKP
jgi:alpha-tubulin suppressor-like RCC1 family protein